MDPQRWRRNIQQRVFHCSSSSECSNFATKSFNGYSLFKRDAICRGVQLIITLAYASASVGEASVSRFGTETLAG